MIKRLIKLPLYILFFISIFTVVIPITFWVITGNNYTNLLSDIDNI